MICPTRFAKPLALARTTCAVGAIALAASACGTLSRTTPTTPARRDSPPTRGRTEAGNRRAAARDAERLLRLVPLPPRAVRVSTEPGGDNRLLNKPPQWLTGAFVDRHAWWRTPASYVSVLAYLEAHAPRTTLGKGSGRMAGPRIPLNHFLTFDLRPVGGVISTRELLFWVVALRGGGTAVRIDGQDVWIVPRPAGERVPAGVHEIDITSVRPHKPPIVSLKLTVLAKVQRIIALINAMEIVQPGAWSCPAFAGGGPVVTFDFRTRAGGRVLARATMTDYGFPSGPCNPVSFSIRGRAQKPLLGGNFLVQVQRLLAVRFR